ncbi:MAG: NADH dehydrogenase ubiquinone Fe-S protein 4, partial [Pseudomonadota bacterium]
MVQSAYQRPDFEVRAHQKQPNPVSADVIDFPQTNARERLVDPREASGTAPIALIHRPARSAMTSGPRAKAWRLDLQVTRPQWLEPLMGWTAGDDPARQISLTFTTKQAAVEFARLQGWRATVLPENRRKPVIKSYADNFRPDR